MESEVLSRVRGDGGRVRVTPEFVSEWAQELRTLAEEATTYVSGGAADAQDTRLCRWENQATDGLKHAWANEDEDPEPFDGATDMRVRLADAIVNEDVALLLVALARAQMSVDPVEGTERERAAVMDLLLRWVLRNHLGVRWLREWVRAVQFAHGDQPGVALMLVTWEREERLRMQRMTLDGLMRLYLRQVAERLAEGAAEGEEAAEEVMGRAQEAAAAFGLMAQDETVGVEVVAGKLGEFFPAVSEGTLRRAARRLQKGEEAEFPVPTVVRDGPEVRALRLGEHWHVPLPTGDFERARAWFRVEWLTEMELRERVRSEGWSEAFVEGLLEHEAEDVFKPAYRRDDDGRLVVRGPEFYRGLYQVVTVFARLVNEDGVTGLYHWPMSGCVTEEVGRAPELLEYAHGGWPGVVYQREVLTERLLDSRGVPELAGVYQGLLKMFTDSFGDHAQLAGVPPVITRGRRRGRQGKLTLKPLVELPAAREGDYRYMDPPKYPEAVVDVVKEIRRQCDEYFGRTNEEVPADHVTVLRTWKTMWFLWTVREALMQMVALIQQWMPEETIRRIVNEAGLELTEGRADIAGRYDIDIHFDPADLDPANLERVATMIQKVVLPMDREATVMTAPLVESFLYRISPDIARRVVRPVEEAAASEVEDEARRLTEIRAGLEPELPEDGSVNYRLRLAWHRKATELNPERDADLPEDKRRILESRLQRMDSLAQQFGENVRIGREGGRRALE